MSDVKTMTDLDLLMAAKECREVVRASIIQELRRLAADGLCTKGIVSLLAADTLATEALREAQALYREGGLQALPMGGKNIEIDGEEFELPGTVVH